MELFCVRLLFLVVFYNFTGFTWGISRWKPDNNWPQFTAFGQISAVTVDPNGDVYVYHRADRKWDSRTFDSHERYANPSDGPIKTTTIVVLHPDGSLLTQTGQSLFYMPHGLTIDHDYNIWITDVALHQVIKFPPVDKSRNNSVLAAPILTLGTALIPGRDKSTFCKPTTVAVDSMSNDFFVADGYCNSRIIKYDKLGNKLLEWGSPSLTPGIFPVYLGPYHMRVPHSLTLDEKRRQLLVADRENSRILCYTTDGNYVHQINTAGRVYGISYSPVTDNLYAVMANANLNGAVFSMKQGNLTGTFAPDQNFQNAHDVAVSPNGEHVYAIELNPFVAWRFTVAEKFSSPKETTDIRKLDTSYNTAPSGPIFPSIDTNLGANQIAVSVVTAVLLLGIIAVACHLYKKRNNIHAMEMRGLILDEDEDRIF